jgi:hypothetical protein
LGAQNCGVIRLRMTAGGRAASAATRDRCRVDRSGLAAIAAAALGRSNQPGYAPAPPHTPALSRSRSRQLVRCRQCSSANRACMPPGPPAVQQAGARHWSPPRCAHPTYGRADRRPPARGSAYRHPHRPITMPAPAAQRGFTQARRRGAG